jgi:hypothetical protein
MTVGLEFFAVDSFGPGGASSGLNHRIFPSRPLAAHNNRREILRPGLLAARIPARQSIRAVP